MSPPLRLGLLGANGRMGQWVQRTVALPEYAARFALVACPRRGESLDGLLETDVVIDFSSPEATLTLASLALQATKPLPAFVIGSTGWSDRSPLDRLAQKAWVLASGNFSTGVLALLRILDQAAPLLDRLGYAPVLVEAHHQHKKDAPSGTAKMIQSALRPGAPASIQTHALRAGETIGDHEVIFHGAADRIRIGHFAQDRSLFARGALDIAVWLADRRGASEGLPGKPLSPDDYLDSLLKKR